MANETPWPRPTEVAPSTAPSSSTTASPSTGRMRAMLDEIDEGFVALDWEYRLTHVNAAASVCSAMRPTSCWRFPARSFGPSSWAASLSVPRVRPWSSGARRSSNIRPTRGFGSRPVLPDHGRVRAYYLEINERKRAEAQLRESRALLQAVLDGSPDPVFVKDQESRILLGNAALLEVWGKPEEEVIGKNDRELYEDPVIGEAMIENDRAVMTSGQSQVLEEIVQTQDGLRTYLSTKTPYRNGEGEIVGILGIARDISRA